MCVETAHGVSISNHEWCTLSETEGFTGVLVWIHTGIEEIRFEVEHIYPRARSLLMSVSSRLLVWLYKAIHSLIVHFSGFEMLTPCIQNETYEARTLVL